jgi:hypothetical protein
MTLDDLDAMLEHLVVAQAASGDPEDGPGLITLSAETRGSLDPYRGMGCANILMGIRYRGLRVLVTRAMEDAVFSRREARARGQEAFEPFEPAPPRV